jgi:hypothetical protein
MPSPDTVLLFSGGRDSTIACLRLIEAGRRPVLVTVTSSHLIGLQTVRRRLAEMRRVLPQGTTWVNVEQPDLGSAFAAAAPTCLPCHLAYVAVGASLARRHQASQLAFGYTTYQSTWVEQTPHAIALLTQALASIGLELALPARDLASKEDANTKLLAAGLTSGALEQKCLQQQRNLPLAGATLEAETTAWSVALNDVLAKLDLVELRLLAEEVVG